MKVLLYIPESNGRLNRFWQAIDSAVPDGQKEVFRTLEQLAKRLRQPLQGEWIGVFVVTDREELDSLSRMRPLIRNIRIILILPNREEDCISIGHLFSPRFLSYLDADVSDVVAVLRKMSGVGS